MYIPLVILEDTFYNAFDDRFVTLAVDSDDIIEFGDIKNPVVVDQLLIDVEREIVFFSLYGLAQAVEDFEDDMQKLVKVLTDHLGSRQHSIFFKICHLAALAVADFFQHANLQLINILILAYVQQEIIKEVHDLRVFRDLGPKVRKRLVKHKLDLRRKLAQIEQEYFFIEHLRTLSL